MESTISTFMSSDIQGPQRGLSLNRHTRKGERQELARIVGRSAYLFALQLTGDPDSAKDIGQDSALKFFKNIDRFDPEQPLEPWLYTIVRNRVRDLSRRNELRKHESLDAWLEQGRAEPADPNADPAVAAEQDELRQKVWASISELPEAHREIIALRDYQDLSYREIAGVLSIPQGTVMSRLHAARKNLSDIIRAKGDTFPNRPSPGRSDQ